MLKKSKHFISKYFFLIIFFCIYFLFLFCVTSFAADPKLVTKLTKAFEKIEDWIITLSTPAAAVAVGTGVFMKKFSFGDEERIRIAKKLIRGSLFSYGFILILDLVLSAIQTLLA